MSRDHGVADDGRSCERLTRSRRAQEGGARTEDVDTRELQAALDAEFGGTDAERRVIARQARDLADAERLAADRGEKITVETVIDELRDAPSDHDLVERWNWWLGSLETAYGGYDRFTVRTVDDEADVNA